MKKRLSLWLVLTALIVLGGCVKKRERVQEPARPAVQQPDPVEPLATPPATAVNQPTAPVATAPVAPVTPIAPRVKGTMPGGAIVQGPSTNVGFLIWGGDMATFWGNGGLETREGTIFAQYGLHLKLVDGNKFESQLTSYKTGKN